MSLDQSIIEYNIQGIIPGPKETEEEYLKRAKYCLSLKESLSEELGSQVPFSGDEFASHATLGSAFKITKKLYGITPSWVPVFFTDYKLAPWQGGCAWIFQVSENSPKSAFIQLRKVFRNSKIYLMLYDREELLSHEMSHVGRLSYSEPKFEEFFAYMSSSSPFRRFFGPIVQSSIESLLFVILLILGLILDISAIALNNPSMFQIVWFSKLVPGAVIAAAFLRLFIRQRQLNRCKKNLELLVQSQDRTGEVLYRLTDLEIITFGKMTPDQVQDYIDAEKPSNFRWKVLSHIYTRLNKE